MTTTVTMLVWPSLERRLLWSAGSEGSPMPPASQPKTQKGVAITSTPKIAPTSCHGPGVATEGDEDQPVLSERDLGEEYALYGAEVLDDTAVGQEQGATDNSGAESEDSFSSKYSRCQEPWP
jgi:hypothetical protein